jgi:hypothetical protein
MSSPTSLPDLLAQNNHQVPCTTALPRCMVQISHEKVWAASVLRTWIPKVLAQNPEMDRNGALGIQLPRLLKSWGWI